ncbi:MAG: VOC family protein [Pseudomonadota bacterium]
MSVVTLNDTITIALTVKDRRASAAWYKTMLGFEIVFQVDEAGWTELSTNVNGVTLGLGEGDPAAHVSAVPVFGVGDLDSARHALEAAGVVFEGETLHVEGMVKLATFLDPDQNALTLAQDLSP